MGKFSYRQIAFLGVFTVHITNLDVAASDENIDFFLTSSKRQAVTHMFLEVAIRQTVFGHDHGLTKNSERLAVSRTNKLAFLRVPCLV